MRDAVSMIPAFLALAGGAAIACGAARAIGLSGPWAALCPEARRERARVLRVSLGWGLGMAAAGCAVAAAL